MILSLRARAFVLLAAINIVVFAAGGLVLTQRASSVVQDDEERLREQMTFLPQAALRPGGDLNVARILAWPSWSFACRDAMLIDRSGAWLADGTYQPLGVWLNPVGSSHRGPAFDEQAILRAMVAAVDTGLEVVLPDGGRAVPIQGEEDVWGGLWVLPPEARNPGVIFGALLPWFVVSTTLLTAATFFLLRRNVLDPVERLASAARRVRAGDLSTRVEEPRRKDEVSELVRSFNDMTSTVQGFSDRLAAEVRRATEQARRAESAAMTQRRLAAMGELAAGIAHEINNPLGGLLNAVESLQREDLRPDRRARYFGLLEDGLERIRSTVQKLLRFTPRATEPVPVDVADVAADAVDLVRHRAREAEVEIAVARPEGELPPVLGERNELGQAVLNLLANALDAIREGRAAGQPGCGAVTIEITVADAEVELAVRDDGPGVDADELERVRDLFYTTKGVDEGTGLGLALVHNVAETHGGRLVLESRAGEGFRASLWLPRADRDGRGR